MLNTTKTCDVCGLALDHNEGHAFPGVPVTHACSQECAATQLAKLVEQLPATPAEAVTAQAVKKAAAEKAAADRAAAIAAAAAAVAAEKAPK